MRGKTIEILTKAMKGGYAVGAFNTTNLEFTQGIVRAANELERDCVIQITPKTMRYGCAPVMLKMIEAVVEREGNSCSIGLHLDHGKSFDDVVEAIEAGVDSVMIDASRMEFKDNMDTTKRVVDYAHEKGVTVQAELGNVPYLGQEEQEINWEEVMTNPQQAAELVEKTGIDALAVGIGNAHGFFREREEPDWERLAKIRELLPDLPLIMHGSSSWKEENVKKAIEGGVCCFNIDTDVRVAAMTEVCNILGDRCEVSDPRKVFGPMREEISKKVKEKIKMFARKN